MTESVNQDQNESTSDQSQSSVQPDPDGSPAWIPAELKAEKTLHKFKDPAGIAKSYIELEKDASRLRNAKGIIVPGENATPEELGVYYKALGRPDTIEGYELSAPELPEGMTYDEGRTKAFAEIAHREGMTKKQISALHSAWNEMEKTSHETNQKSAKDFLDSSTVEMKKEWGKDFDANLSQADSAIDKIFGSDFNKMLKDTGLANHPAIVRGMFKASQALGEHSLARDTSQRYAGETFTREKLISMKLDKRYENRDPAYLKEVEAYNKAYAESLGANS